MKDPYELLGVDRKASQDEIKRAYRRLAHLHHPDKNPHDAVAEERFKEASQAYELLSDPKQRRRYDRFGPAAFGDRGHGGGPGGFGDTFGDIFSDLFSGRRRSRARKGRSRHYRLVLDFRTAMLGGERALSVTRNKSCEPCGASGAKPGTTPRICHACGGSGEIRLQQGMLTAAKRCSYCDGRGKIIAERCTECGGRGRLEQQTQLRVRIPPGSDDGTVIRYAAEGEPGREGGPPGDLEVVLEVEPHDFFSRRGNDLSCEMPITISDAVLGTQIDLPTLDGKVRMRITAGTENGQVYRIKGRGVPSRGRNRGDLLVRVVIEVPTKIDAEQQRLFETLRDIDDSHYPRRQRLWEDLE